MLFGVMQCTHSVTNLFWMYALIGVINSRMGDHPGLLVTYAPHTHERYKPTVLFPTVPLAYDLSYSSLNSDKKIKIILFNMYVYSRVQIRIQQLRNLFILNWSTYIIIYNIIYNIDVRIINFLFAYYVQTNDCN